MGAESIAQVLSAEGHRSKNGVPFAGRMCFGSCATPHLSREEEAGASEAPTADDVAEWARDLGVLIGSATPQQRKALIRLLVKELRVMSRKEIFPTYKIPALVRAPEGQVDLAARCVNRLPLLQRLHDRAAA